MPCGSKKSKGKGKGKGKGRLVTFLMSYIISGCGGIGTQIMPDTLALYSAQKCTTELESTEGYCAAVIIEVETGEQVLITAAHCVGDGSGVKVENIDAIVDTIDIDQDLAVVRPIAGKFSGACKTARRAPVQGEMVVVYGYPFGLQKAATFGRVAVTSAFVEDAKTFVVDVTTWNGNSGGGAWDCYGKLLGIDLVMPAGGTPAFGFFAHPESIDGIIKRWLNEQSKYRSRRTPAGGKSINRT